MARGDDDVGRAGEWVKGAILKKERKEITDHANPRCMYPSPIGPTRQHQLCLWRVEGMPWTLPFLGQLAKVPEVSKQFLLLVPKLEL